jgi:cardiolipin synthase
MSRPLRAPYPFVPVEGAQLFLSLEATWEQLLRDLEQAQEEILIENYILIDSDSTDALMVALTKAHANGAKIQIHIDAAGSYLLSRKQQAAIEAIAELKIYHPLSWAMIFGGLRNRMMRRTHRRIFVIDHKLAWTGGMAFADQWWTTNPEACREIMMRMEGAIVAHCHDAFMALWHGEVRKVDLRSAVPSKPEQWRLLPQYASGRRLFRLGLRRAVGQAQERVWLRTAYFIPPRRLRRALCLAAERGLDVRLLLPSGTHHDHPAVRLAGHRYYGQLLRSGVRIFEYQPRFQHGKAALFDRERVIIGTPNIDQWSFVFNHEIAVQARSESLGAETAAQFVADFADSTEIDLARWRKRPLWRRVRESFVGLFDRWF